VLSRRRELLIALAGGELEHIPDFDLIPPQKLTEGAVRRGRAEVRGDWLRLYGAFVVAAAIFGVAATPLRHRSHESGLWDAAQRSHLARDYRAYLRQFPHGRHKAAAETALSALYGDVIAKFRGRMADSPGAAGIVAMLEALGRSDSELVLVKYR